MRKWQSLPPEMQNEKVEEYYKILKKHKVGRFLKRTFDIVVSFVVLLMLSWVFLIIALIIKIDSKGPVFFRQERITRYGKSFRIFKFRTMVNNADKMGSAVTANNDCRVTKVGKVLRKFRIDEIPQLIDILRGTMTFVGTRPEVPKFVACYTPEMYATLLMPAGVTSLASICYKDEAQLLECADNADEVYAKDILPAKMRYNLKALKEFSFFRDLSIMVKTVFAVLGKDYADKEGLEVVDGTTEEQKDLVSVIMPAYNSGRFIDQTIQSVLNQTYTNWELLLVDDCSTDDTDAIVQKYLVDSRIRYFKNEKNSGAAYSRNYALREAKGRWIAFLDSDDLWLPEKLEKQIDFMKSNGWHFSYTAYEHIDELSEKLNVVVTGPGNLSKRKMFLCCYPGCLTVMYDADKMGVLQIPDEIANGENDYALWLKGIKIADCGYLSSILSQYRIVGNSLSHKSSKWKIIKNHYKMYRWSEKRNVLFALAGTVKNVMFTFIKKRKYVKNVEN